MVILLLQTTGGCLVTALRIVQCRDCVDMSRVVNIEHLDTSCRLATDGCDMAVTWLGDTTVMTIVWWLGYEENHLAF